MCVGWSLFSFTANSQLIVSYSLDSFCFFSLIWSFLIHFLFNLPLLFRWKNAIGTRITAQWWKQQSWSIINPLYDLSFVLAANRWRWVRVLTLLRVFVFALGIHVCASARICTLSHSKFVTIVTIYGFIYFTNNHFNSFTQLLNERRQHFHYFHSHFSCAFSLIVNKYKCFWVRCRCFLAQNLSLFSAKWKRNSHQ